MTYRRRLKSDTWHFMGTCTLWPSHALWFKHPGDYIERKKKPTTGELCNQCLAKQRKEERDV